MPSGLSDGPRQLKDQWRIRILQESDTPILPGTPPVYPSVLKIDVVVSRSYSIPLFDIEALQAAVIAFKGMNLEELIPLIELAKAQGTAIAPFISTEWRDAPAGQFVDDDLIQLATVSAQRPTGRFEGTGKRGDQNFVVLGFAGYERRILVTKETIPEIASAFAQRSEPPRLFRRLFSLSHAALA
jgi:hypothetical protein